MDKISEDNNWIKVKQPAGSWKYGRFEPTITELEEKHQLEARDEFPNDYQD